VETALTAIWEVRAGWRETAVSPPGAAVQAARLGPRAIQVAALIPVLPAMPTRTAAVAVARKAAAAAVVVVPALTVAAVVEGEAAV